MARFSVIFLMFLLAGCAADAKIKAEPQFKRIQCKQYSKAQVQAAAAELRAKGYEVPTISEFVDDYGNLRKAVCRNLAK